MSTWYNNFLSSYLPSSHKVTSQYYHWCTPLCSELDNFNYVWNQVSILYSCITLFSGIPLWLLILSDCYVYYLSNWLIANLNLHIWDSCVEIIGTIHDTSLICRKLSKGLCQSYSPMGVPCVNYIIIFCSCVRSSAVTNRTIDMTCTCNKSIRGNK